MLSVYDYMDPQSWCLGLNLKELEYIIFTQLQVDMGCMRT